MSTPTPHKPPRRPATRSRKRAASEHSDFAISATAARAPKVFREVIAASKNSEHEALVNEVNNLKARIRALNAANLNLRRRISELEARDKT
jgi:phosphoribosyl-ATP pyrophosphohydrolase